MSAATAVVPTMTLAWAVRFAERETIASCGEVHVLV
jgi:hypothetical protein